MVLESQGREYCKKKGVKVFGRNILAHCFIPAGVAF